MNNPMAITNSFTVFLSANPRRNPPTNPPPMIADIGVKRSIVKS